MRHLITALLAVVALFAFGSTASAQGSAGDTSISVVPDTVAPGGTIEVTGTCGPDAETDPVPILVGGGIEGGQLGEVSIDPVSGEFSTTLTIPVDSPSGIGTLFAGCGLGGDIDPATPLTIAADTSDGTGDSDPGAPSVGRGDSGELVAFWQDRLNEWLALAGADVGPLAVDGIFGPSTEEATRVFQEASGLVAVDGVVDPEDRVALREAIEALEGAPSDRPDQPGADEPVELTRSCESPEGWTVDYPTGWSTNSGEVVAGCSMFDPEPFQVPEGTDERVAAINAFVSQAPYFEAATPEPEPTSRAQTEIDGQHAVRIETVAGEDFIYPADTEITRYVVDLSEDVAEQGPTLLVDTVDLNSIDYDRAVRVLDEMVRTMELTVGADRPDSVVARYDGASIAASIVATASDGQICLSLDVADEESCVATPAPDALAVTSLGDELQSFVVGAAGQDVFRVEVVSGDTSTAFLPGQVPDTDVRGWGIPGDPDDVTEVEAYDIGGELLTTVTDVGA